VRRRAMDEQELIHRISVNYNINIEILKDLFHDDKLWDLIKKAKTMDAINYIRSLHRLLGLFEVKKIVEEFSAALK
jgi:hypothetical protein